MYKPIDLARFALSEFQRDLVGLTDDEARVRMKKSDGTEMNAISWTVGHIAGHWLNRPQRLQRVAPGSLDTSPPSLDQARALLAEAHDVTEGWLPNADDALLAQTPDALRGESIGTGIMRAVLHTWFHNGEINAVRQLLGHDEIVFLGDITEHLEWRGGMNGTTRGYRPDELARFTFSEFERGLNSLTDEEAVVRSQKSDDTRMNAISWTIGHIAVSWYYITFLMTGQPMPDGIRSFFGPDADPTPPQLAEARELFGEARRRTAGWLPAADDERLSAKSDIGPMPNENFGTQLMRAVLHTWFHTGEINAMRQMLGHEEIPFVGQLIGNLEWRTADDL